MQQQQQLISSPRRCHSVKCHTQTPQKDEVEQPEKKELLLGKKHWPTETVTEKD